MIRHKFGNYAVFNALIVMFYGRFFQQTVGIPMGTNCAPLLSDLFLYLYEADFIQGLLMKIEYIARSFKLRFRYMDDVLSLNNFKFGDYADHIYLIELEIKDTINTTISRLHTLTYT